jgi:hypothetical protein
MRRTCRSGSDRRRPRRSSGFIARTLDRLEQQTFEQDLARLIVRLTREGRKHQTCAILPWKFPKIPVCQNKLSTLGAFSAQHASPLLRDRVYAMANS